MKTNTDFNTADINNYLQTFKRFPVCFARGKGSRLWDVEGNEYIDMLAGIAVNNVGHCHPEMVQAVQDQAAQLTHISNFFTSEPQVRLSRKLTGLSGLDRVFLTNSGAESVEGAIKLARKYAHSKGRGGVILSFKGCFHGRTLGTIATGKKKMQQGFDPIPSGFVMLDKQDMTLVREHAGKETAAILIEPIQGEGGIHPADEHFMQELWEFCNTHDIVLIFDEIQCGMGRTGYWFAKDYYKVQPDIMTLAKGLGGGVPIGAILSSKRVSEAIDFGDHGTTFGGNPLVCASALSVIEIIEKEQLLEAAREKGSWLKNRIRKLNDDSIKEIRGLGLMIGIEFDFPTKPLMMEMFRRRVIVNATADTVIRLVPALNVSYEELSTMMDALEKSIAVIKKETVQL